MSFYWLQRLLGTDGLQWTRFLKAILLGDRWPMLVCVNIPGCSAFSLLTGLVGPGVGIVRHLLSFPREHHARMHQMLIRIILPGCSAFSPLTGFMGQATYEHVVEHERLPVRCTHVLTIVEFDEM